ncbi:DUF6328 family protein [Streptomyces sp. CA-294286]|uniref:DUF6328 family protein n=1 Tax=Streptomyces sp. CA-294286 TaxID=3240070 RepID=UPI003D8E2634
MTETDRQPGADRPEGRNGAEGERADRLQRTEGERADRLQGTEGERADRLQGTEGERADRPQGAEGERADRSQGRNETEDERADRQWGELVQEIRVAQTGVQILLGFLLTVVFQPTFHDLPETDKILYVITIVLGSTATGALIGPVSFHRIVSGRRIKPQAVVWASRLTFLGLVLLLATLSCALLLVMRVVTHNAYAPWLVAGVVTWYLLCWYFLPMWARRKHTTD